MNLKIYPKILINALKIRSIVKPVLSGHSKIDKTKILMTNDSLMKVESIEECSSLSILQYFNLHKRSILQNSQPALSNNRSWNQFGSSFWVATLNRFYCTSFTLINMYTYQHVSKNANKMYSIKMCLVFNLNNLQWRLQWAVWSVLSMCVTVRSFKIFMCYEFK